MKTIPLRPHRNCQMIPDIVSTPISQVHMSTECFWVLNASVTAKEQGKFDTLAVLLKNKKEQLHTSKAYAYMFLLYVCGGEKKKDFLRSVIQHVCVFPVGLLNQCSPKHKCSTWLHLNTSALSWLFNSVTLAHSHWFPCLPLVVVRVRFSSRASLAVVICLFHLQPCRPEHFDC